MICLTFRLVISSTWPTTNCLTASVTSARDGDVAWAPQHRDYVPVQLLTCRLVRSWSQCARASRNYAIIQRCQELSIGPAKGWGSHIEISQILLVSRFKYFSENTRLLLEREQVWGGWILWLVFLLLNRGYCGGANFPLHWGNTGSVTRDCCPRNAEDRNEWKVLVAFPFRMLVS